MGKRTREYIYGMNAAQEVLRAGRRTVYSAFLNKAASQQNRMLDLMASLELKNVSIEYVEGSRLDELAPGREHQGVILKTGTYPYKASSELLARDRLLLLDGVEDPQNVGVILRSAEVFGFSGVMLPIKGVPEVYPSIVRVSAGASEFLDISRDATAGEYAAAAREAGYTIVALDAAGDTDIRTAAGQIRGKMLLVIGGEDTGVSDAVIEASDIVAAIEQHGKINSLNAAVAAGIALSCFA